MNNVTRKSDGTPPSKGFRLDKTNAKLAGVCGGIASYANIDPMLVRLGFVIGALVSFGTVAIVYLAIALIAD
ncbi:PspC domain-containing protein [Erythrobacter sp. JK5]|uniref:PspC domain-containing protein n=1 Tax=Erythrobacter sp. JK5 TaxID=2829500 RepID=UPI001BAC564E|nr:PspC domain-containing protein [Erythrobacter sp. JK5]QUL38224.1 PspC domain-containing protein [Erythrobacter sp. JK5]